MRAGYETTVESRILLSYLSPQKLETVYGRKLNYFSYFRLPYKSLRKLQKSMEVDPSNGTKS